MAEYRTSMVLPTEQQRVFEYLIRPANLAELLPDDAGVTVVEAPEILELGSRIELIVYILGIKQQIVYEVSDFEPPLFFSERQIDGPLKSYLHEHRVEIRSENEVELIDAISFEPPSGLAGFVMTEKRILENLQKGLSYRYRQIQTVMSSNGE